MTSEPKNTASFNIPYYPDLIQHLHNDHKIILQKMQQIKDLITAKDMQQTAQEVDLLRSATLEHVSEENLKLYVYLQYSLKDRPDDYAKMRLLRKKMDFILISLIDFFNKYKEVHNNLQLQETLLADFSTISAMYIKRIKTEEEELFPTYQPID